MKTAVILGAGRGMRLRSEVRDYPKGFLRLGQKSIVEESIQRLSASGIEKVIVVTGYCAEHYQRLAAGYPGLMHTVHNPRFAESGSAYSLYCARGETAGPFLLLESDLIYEPRAIEVLINHPAQDAILLSGPTRAGDEVFVQARKGTLESMSKNRSELGDVSGELVGISKISSPLFGIMNDWARDQFRHSLMIDYETDVLVAAAQRRPIACPRVDNLLWAEIDDVNHLARARELIYPALGETGISD
jgi:choline kinase